MDKFKLGQVVKIVKELPPNMDDIFTVEEIHYDGSAFAPYRDIRYLGVIFPYQCELIKDIKGI